MKYLACVLAFVGSAAAADYRVVTDQQDFLALLGDRELTNRLYDLQLRVLPNGQIDGSALGWDVEGNWSWRDGYFCREMAWGGDPIPFNCQLVEVNGDQMRFTVDQGNGRAASFRLR